MPDIIHLLPDSIANQIAAGEVIQRPASVIKELVENSIDAGASHINIILKDAGRTLIQVIDNGKGMSMTDARMAFERHATSKITSADDLFTLKTKGFRGEALASIAAIAHVELKTRRAEDEVGTLIQIAASKLEKQEVTASQTGTCISVKNIFFNVPARRKFLKSNEVERRNIFIEVERIALIHPSIEFTLTENDLQTLYLPATSLRQRIIQLEGKNINPQLIEIHTETSLAKIHGYISKPENAKKGKASQFFFANNRFIKHPYFHRAVMKAYEPLILPNLNPSYFIYIDVDPGAIDVNIHPTKTEVKFENEQAMWQILMVTLKEALGKFNAVPSIDFDRQDAIDIPIYNAETHVKMPKITVNPSYNPFESASSKTYLHRRPDLNWEKLYSGFESENNTENIHADILFPKNTETELTTTSNYFQYKNRYILTSVKSGLMFIDQHRAHTRILFDKYLEQIKSRKGVTQRLLFPEIIDITFEEELIFNTIQEDLEGLGFELSNLGNRQYAIQGIPSKIENGDISQILRCMLQVCMDIDTKISDEMHESIALSMARMTAIPYERALSNDEMKNLTDEIFSCTECNHTPDGKTIIYVLSDDEIIRKMK